MRRACPAVLAFAALCLAAAAADSRPRLIIETDAGGDPDDEQSLVRFLVYANEFDVEGIIANRAKARDGENKNPIRDGLGIVRALIRAYGECHANLAQHDPRFPAPEALLAKTVAGYQDRDEGVNLVIRAVDAPDPRPVWFSNWGTDHGSAESCLKRALDRVLRERGPEGYAAFKRKLRLSSADKFGEHTTTIEPPFPLWVNTSAPELGGKRWYHRFSAITAKAGGFDLERDARAGHGPLGALYPVNTGLPQKEGDTMMFLYLLPTGMNDPARPDWGSWAGRHARNEQHGGKPYYWASPADTWQGSTHRDNILIRWAAHIQNDFRARMDWCVADRFEKANHAPVAVLNGNRSKDILELEARPGATMQLTSHGSMDPDGQELTTTWIPYPEAGTFRGALELSAASGEATSFVVPGVTKPETAHILLQVQDHGTPSLVAYRRAVITIRP